MDIKQYEAMLNDAESRLKRLRSLYEQWFAGIERIEPQQQRRDFDLLMQTMRRDQPRNTALRFRFNQVVQRYTTFTTYWRRISRQIEEGTYKRDVIRARRLTEVAQSEPPPPRPESYEVDVEVDRAIDAGLDAALGGGPSAPPPARPTPRPNAPISPFAMPAQAKGAPEPLRSFPVPATASPGALPGAFPGGLNGPRLSGAPPIPADARRPPPPPIPGARPFASPAAVGAANNHAGGHTGGPASGIADDQMKRIFERYVEARRQNQERTDVKFESVASSVRGMLPKLMQKHAGKNIDFEVVVKDGKVALKPVAK